jgi:asparagine synthase (glutamine-hydrolysing)
LAIPRCRRSAAAWNRPCRGELDSLLRQSVREHLLSDVPLGIWLSGGLDSSDLAALCRGRVVVAAEDVSISFAGRSFDESAHIRGTAARSTAPTTRNSTSTPRVGLADAIEQFAYYFDEPNADGGALPVWFLSRLTRQNVTVALSGEGADELFGGYLTYRADRACAACARRLPAMAVGARAEGRARWPVSDEKISFEYMLKRFVEGCLMPAGQAHVYWNGTFSEAEKAALVAGPLPGALAGILRDLSGKATTWRPTCGSTSSIIFPTTSWPKWTA